MKRSIGGVEQEFNQEAERYDEERKMPWISHFERRAIEKGLQEGRQEGMVPKAREDVIEVLSLRFRRISRSLKKPSSRSMTPRC